MEAGRFRGGEQPLLFVGTFPVGRLCAGWMAAFRRLRAKAGRLPHRLSLTAAPQCVSALWPRREKGRGSDRGRGQRGRDFGRRGKEEVVRKEMAGVL